MQFLIVPILAFITITADATAPMTYNGEIVQIGEYRFQVLILLGIWWPIALALAYGFWDGRPWSRHIFVGGYVLATIYAVIRTFPETDLGGFLVVALFIAPLIWYFYLKPNVSNYYSDT